MQRKAFLATIGTIALAPLATARNLFSKTTDTHTPRRWEGKPIKLLSGVAAAPDDGNPWPDVTVHTYPVNGDSESDVLYRYLLNAAFIMAAAQCGDGASAEQVGARAEQLMAKLKEERL